MASTVAVADVRRVPSVPGAGARDRRFYTGIAIAALATVFAGFSRTFYLKTITGAPALPLLVHLHGLVFTSWMLLFVAQTALVASARTRVHRRLGVAGGWLAALMVVVGFATARSAVARGFNPPAANMPDSLSFMIVPVRDLVVFSTLIGLALYYRNRPEAHKRLMLLATANVVPAAISRLPGSAAFPAMVPVIAFGFLLAGPIYDVAARRRVHPAYIGGVALTIASLVAESMLGPTEAWRSVARVLSR